MLVTPESPLESLAIVHTFLARKRIRGVELHCGASSSSIPFRRQIKWNILHILFSRAASIYMHNIHVRACIKYNVYNTQNTVAHLRKMSLVVIV